MSNSATLYRAPFLAGNDVGNAVNETQMPNGRGTPLILPLPSNGSLGNRRFRVVIAGTVSATISTTFALNVYFGQSANIGSNTLIFPTGANPINNESTSFEVWIDLFWGAGSKSISGRGEGNISSNTIGPNSLANFIMNVDPSRDSSTFLASGPTYGFTITGQFGNSSTDNHATVNIFDLEHL